MRAPTRTARRPARLADLVELAGGWRSDSGSGRAPDGMICLVGERGPAPVRVPHDDDREPIMRDGPMLSCEGLAGEPASAVGAVTDCLPPAFVDCLLDSALEPVLDAAAQRGGQAAKRKNGDKATEVAKALLTVTVCDPACGSG